MKNVIATILHMQAIMLRVTFCHFFLGLMKETSNPHSNHFFTIGSCLKDCWAMPWSLTCIVIQSLWPSSSAHVHFLALLSHHWDNQAFAWVASWNSRTNELYSCHFLMLSSGCLDYQILIQSREHQALFWYTFLDFHHAIEIVNPCLSHFLVSQGHRAQ